jgi:hypothetical protein
MNPDPSLPGALARSLRACAHGIYPDEAAVGLIISHATFLHRADFTSQFINYGTDPDGTVMAAVDWDTAIAVLNGGGLPCSGGEQRILKVSASLGAGIPVNLRDAVTGLDDLNIQRLLTAIKHGAGKRPRDQQTWAADLVQRSYRVLHAAARLVRGGRRRRWKIPASWPWTEAIIRAWQRIRALPDTG